MRRHALDFACFFYAALALAMMMAWATTSSNASEESCPPPAQEPCQCKSECQALLGSDICFVVDPDNCPTARYSRTLEASGGYILCPDAENDAENCTGSWGNWSPCTEIGSGLVGEQCRRYQVAKAASNGGTQCPHAHCEVGCQICELEPVYEEQQVCEDKVIESPGLLTRFISSTNVTAREGEITQEQCKEYLMEEGRKWASRTLGMEASFPVDHELLPYADAVAAAFLSENEEENETERETPRHEIVRIKDSVPFLAETCSILETDYQCKGCQERDEGQGGGCLEDGHGVISGHVECIFKIESYEQHCNMKEVCIKHCHNSPLSP